MNKLNWEHDFLTPTKNFSNLIQKYSQFFNVTLELPVKQFNFVLCLRSNHLIVLSDSASNIEPLIKNHNPKTHTFFTAYDDLNPGYQVIEKENTITLCITEKTPCYAQTFYLECGLPSTGKESFYDKRTVLLKKYLDNRLIIRACLEQLKHEVYCLLQDKKIESVDLKNINVRLAPCQHNPEKKAEALGILMKLKSLDQSNLYLKEVMLSLQEECCLSLYTQGFDENKIAHKMNQPLEKIKACFVELRKKLHITINTELFIKKDQLMLLHSVA